MVPFSPLFIAALTATQLSHVSLGVHRVLSVRFSSRHSLLPHDKTETYHTKRRLSVRFSSRHSLLQCRPCQSSDHLAPFSPLFIAALTATR